MFRYFYAYWPIDVRSTTMFPGHEFQVTGIGVDDVGLRIEYRVVPALPRSSQPWWDWDAHDDQGSAYESIGGAYGTTPDGVMTDGSLSLRPIPPSGNRTLHVRIAPGGLDGLPGRLCSFSVDLDVPDGLGSGATHG